MITATCKTKWEGEKVKKKLDDTTFKTISHAASTVRLIAKRSIRSSKKKSAVGTPPHTHTKKLPRSIIYYADKKTMWAIVGTSVNIVGEAGQAHEFGGLYKRTRYDKRPFMLPALEKVAPRLPSEWASNFR